MLADVVDLIRCPHCAGEMSLAGGTVGCPGGHRFDVARQGHLHLLRTPAGATADTTAMVADRVAFLQAGHYAPIATLVASAAVGSIAVEPGAGTGYYLNAVVARLTDYASARGLATPTARGLATPTARGLATPTARGLATDLSAYACRRAAKLPRIGAIVADTWDSLPIHDRVADTLLTVFAPRNPAEFARVCARSGRVLVVTPLPEHLDEVRRTRGLMTIENNKHERLLADTRTWLVHDGHEVLRYEVLLSPLDVTRLIGMGPNAFHLDAAAGATGPDGPVTTTVAVRLDVFRPR